MPLYTPGDFKREVQAGELEAWRSEFRRDYARLIHSAAFRRLGGKTQLYPGVEHDFFRNRLTHSLEVAQISKSIAIRLNNFEFKEDKIDTDLVEFSALAHDLGHPPFGHNGEKALDDCMKQWGGFEGNAQTLRILSRLEKYETPPNFSGVHNERGEDCRVGLNLTYRTLASILKYDKKIPTRSKREKIVKGYYNSEERLVEKIKKNILSIVDCSVHFKVIECYIMDIADDIAYSTYDLEDTLKAGFSSLMDILGISEELFDKIVEKMIEKIPSVLSGDVIEILNNMFSVYFVKADDITQQFKLNEMFSSNGYLRSQLTSRLVNQFMQGVRVDYNLEFPNLSKVYLEDSVLRKVEVLKHFTFQNMIMSSRLKVSEFRGYDIIRSIFKALDGSNGFLLFPDDYRQIYLSAKSETARKRVICDFIAGMTDRYAIEFYGRLKSESPQSIFKPL